MATKLTREEKKAKDLADHTAREATFHLVSKIISWKTRSQDSVSMQAQSKISKDEWKRYQKHLLEISKSEYVEDVKKKLKKIYDDILENQGFE